MAFQDKNKFIVEYFGRCYHTLNLQEVFLMNKNEDMVCSTCGDKFSINDLTTPEGFFQLWGWMRGLSNFGDFMCQSGFCSRDRILGHYIFQNFDWVDNRVAFRDTCYEFLKKEKK